MKSKNNQNSTNQTKSKKLNHYSVYMQIYGLMMIELAQSDQERIKLMNGDYLSPFMVAIRDRIEDSPCYEYK